MLGTPPRLGVSPGRVAPELPFVPSDDPSLPVPVQACPAGPGANTEAGFETGELGAPPAAPTPPVPNARLVASRAPAKPAASRRKDGRGVIAFMRAILRAR